MAASFSLFLCCHVAVLLCIVRLVCSVSSDVVAFISSVHRLIFIICYSFVFFFSLKFAWILIVLFTWTSGLLFFFLSLASLSVLRFTSLNRIFKRSFSLALFNTYSRTCWYQMDFFLFYWNFLHFILKEKKTVDFFDTIWQCFFFICFSHSYEVAACLLSLCCLYSHLIQFLFHRKFSEKKN